MARQAITLAPPLAALILLAGCGGVAQEQPGKADAKAITEQLRNEEAQWNRDYAVRDAAKLAGHYAQDAALANPGAPLATGADEVRKAVTEFAADPKMKVSFASDRIQVAASGDLAYTRGHFDMEGTDPATGKARRDSGNYLTVWQKQADGSWKAVEDFVVPGPAGAPPVSR